MALSNDTIESAATLSATTFVVDLRNANSEYAGWANDAFWKYTAPSDGHIAIWLSYADDNEIYRNTVALFRSPFTSVEYIGFDIPDDLSFFDSGDLYGVSLPISSGETVYVSIGRDSFLAPPPAAYTVEWVFNASAVQTAGAPGGRSALMVGQQLNGDSPIDRSWRFHAILREGATVSIGATYEFLLDVDTFQSDHCMCRIDDTRSLWAYDAFPEGFAFGSGVRARVVTYDEGTITVGPESIIHTHAGSLATLDNAQAMCSDGDVAFFALRKTPSQSFMTFRINSDGTLTLLDSFDVGPIGGSYDRGTVCTGPSRAMTFEYIYGGVNVGRWIRKVTWDSAGIITLSDRTSVPFPPYSFDYYQSYMFFVNNVVVIAESWDVDNLATFSEKTVMGLRAIDPDTLEIGPVANTITLDIDPNVSDTIYYESLEPARQYTEVGVLADGQYGIAYMRFKPYAERTYQIVSHPLTFSGLEITVDTDNTHLLFEALNFSDITGDFMVPEDTYLFIQNLFLNAGLVFSWFYDSVDQYFHHVAQSVSSTAGVGSVTLDLDTDSHYTWIAAHLYGETFAPPDLSGNFKAGDRGFYKGKMGL